MTLASERGAAVVPSVLFGDAELGDRAQAGEQPAYFGDLNLDQIVPRRSTAGSATSSRRSFMRRCPTSTRSGFARRCSPISNGPRSTRSRPASPSSNSSSATKRSSARCVMTTAGSGTTTAREVSSTRSSPTAMRCSVCDRPRRGRRARAWPARAARPPRRLHRRRRVRSASRRGARRWIWRLDAIRYSFLLSGAADHGRPLRRAGGLQRRGRRDVRSLSADRHDQRGLGSSATGRTTRRSACCTSSPRSTPTRSDGSTGSASGMPDYLERDRRGVRPGAAVLSQLPRVHRAAASMPGCRSATRGCRSRTSPSRRSRRSISRLPPSSPATAAAVVRNDVRLDGAERMLVITGPNNGGKTTLARAIGQLHHLARLGCPVPGRDTRLFLCDRIFTRFERREDISTLSGKLQDELNRLREQLRAATPGACSSSTRCSTPRPHTTPCCSAVEILGHASASWTRSAYA